MHSRVQHLEPYRRRDRLVQGQRLAEQILRGSKVLGVEPDSVTFVDNSDKSSRAELVSRLADRVVEVLSQL